MSLKSQSDCLRRIVAELSAIGIPITGVYMPTDNVDGGLEINDTYVLQIAPYHSPQFILDKVELPGEEVASFVYINQLILFLMEN